MAGTNMHRWLGRLVARTLCACALVASVLMLAPARAQAASADALEVTQSFSQTGSVPEGLGDAFSYLLSSTTEGAPLPPGAQADGYAFAISGNAAVSLPLVLGRDPHDGALSFSRVGVYGYELRCITDPAGTAGLAVDPSVWSIRIAIENDEATGGLKVGWIEARNLQGSKFDQVSFAHSYVGAPAAADAVQAFTAFGIKLPQMGDSLWILVMMSAAICALGVVLAVMAVRKKARRRAS